MAFQPRPKQAEVLTYTGGKMGISAVPGSGKTRTLSALAAKLIATGGLSDEQEVLVVTLVKSAVGNFARQVSAMLRTDYKLLPNFGYRVRTLHGLANDIVRERPALAGLSDDFVVIDEREADDILQGAVDAWLKAHPDALHDLVDEQHLQKPKVRNVDIPRLATSVASAFIKQAKNEQRTPEELTSIAHKTAASGQLPLLDMCLSIYDQYQYGLRYRGGVDFQDLIRLALQVLQSDADLLARLRQRWPYILEDEAQDSSRLQETILRVLVGEAGNWVRVGDPNQAIYETFTTADPQLLRDFLREADVQARELPDSGRSTASIIKLANALIDFSLDHPHPSVKAKLPLSTPYIRPTPADDPQGNPPDNPAAIHLIGSDYTAEDERANVVRSLAGWLPGNPEMTCAVLLPQNDSGAKMVNALRDARVDYVENLRTTSSTRAVVGALTHIMRYLAQPDQPAGLAQCYVVWRRDAQDDPDAQDAIAAVKKMLRALPTPEDFLYPQMHDWLQDTVSDDDAALGAQLGDFRRALGSWMNATTLPIDQLILTIAGDLYTQESELATSYSAALYMRRFAEQYPSARLPQYADELKAIATNKRKFQGLSEDDDAFDPDQHKGKVTVTTMHKAKGLEWDRVYLMTVNNYGFPSAQSYDNYISEKYFLQGELNLEAEALAQLDVLLHGGEYVLGPATDAARVEYAAERLRLLYVGITRARRELVITWNTGRFGNQQEALPLAALRGLWYAQMS